MAQQVKDQAGLATSLNNLGFAWLYMHSAQLIPAGESAGPPTHDPACDSDIRQRLDELMPQLEDVLSPAELQAALECGKTLELDTLVAELLEKFAVDNA